MIPSRKLKLAAACALMTLGSAAHAQSEKQKESEPRFFIHAGPGGVYFNTRVRARSAQTGAPITGLDGRIDDDYSLLVEAGYKITKTISASLTVGVPPVAGLKAAGPVGDSIGNPTVGSARYGPAVFTAQYHLPGIGPVHPYVGAGGVYLIVFHSSDGVLDDFKVRNRFGAAVQAGLDVDLTRRWGLFVDVKKLWVNTHISSSGGLLPPALATVRLDPTVVHAGVSLRF